MARVKQGSCKPIEDNNGLWSLRSHPQIDVNKVDLLICVSQSVGLRSGKCRRT